MRSIAIAIVAVLVIGGLIYRGLIYQAPSHLPSSPAVEVVDAAVAKRKTAGTNTTLDLRRLGSVPYDELVVFHAYTSSETVRAALGFPAGEIERSVTSVQEGGALLVFIRGSTVLAATLYPGSKLGFPCVRAADPIPAARAVFLLEYQEQRLVASPKQKLAADLDRPSCEMARG